jgi:DNA modification methylase
MSYVQKVVIGDATLYQGEVLQVLPLMAVADLVIADPPYGIGESGRKNASRGKPFGKVDGKNTRGTEIAPRDYGAFTWDDKPPTAQEMAAAIASGKNCILWGANHIGMPPASKWLCWDKLNSGDFADCELAWTNLPGAVRIFRHMWNGMLRDSERDTPRVHPTQKPIALMGWCIEQAGKPQSIGEPWMGSAPAGCAAVALGLPYWGIERDPGNFAKAVKRIEKAHEQGQLFAPVRQKQEQEALL